MPDSQMRPSLFSSDKSLPAWLHTMLLFLIVSPFWAFLFWHGFSAISTAHLEPLSGPEFGQFFFGNITLDGKAARIAGVSLIFLACSFVALAVQFSRFACVGAVTRILPWIFVAAHIVMSMWVKSLV